MSEDKPKWDVWDDVRKIEELFPGRRISVNPVGTIYVYPPLREERWAVDFSEEILRSHPK